MTLLPSILGKKKHKTVTWFVTSLILFTACQTEEKSNVSTDANVQKIQGETQGTTYGIQIVDGPEVTKAEIDSILHDFDMSLSGYIPESIVSKMNQGAEDFVVPNTDKYFVNCFNLSKDLFWKTDGAFDPTVLPLMKLWGFLKDIDQVPNQVEIDSVMKFVGFSDKAIRYLNPYKLETKVDGTSGHLFSRADSRLQLDFNAIAQGYSVDVIADFLKEKGCKNLYVEIGGEIYVEGHNSEGGDWRLGVDKPVAGNDGKNQRVISAVIGIDKGGIATSGNYRKFYEKGGKIYAHTLNPITGHPAENEILSATVIAKNAGIADGMATAFMVMGLEKTKEFLRTKNTDQLDVLIIYSNEKQELQSWTTEGMDKRLL